MGRIKQMLIEQEDMELDIIQVFIQDGTRDLTIDEAEDLYKTLGYHLQDYQTEQDNKENN